MQSALTVALQEAACTTQPGLRGLDQQRRELNVKRMQNDEGRALVNIAAGGTSGVIVVRVCEANIRICSSRHAVQGKHRLGGQSYGMSQLCMCTYVAPRAAICIICMCTCSSKRGRCPLV